MKNIRFISEAAIIAALYCVFTILFLPISFGSVQCRISEALCVLPALFSSAVPGITLGCFIANILGGAMGPDIIFGTLATFIGAVFTYLISSDLRKKIRIFLESSYNEDNKKGLKISLLSRVKVVLPPVLSNSIIVPLVLKYAYMLDDAYIILVIGVGIGEIISVGILGNILLSVLTRKDVLFQFYKLKVIS